MRYFLSILLLTLVPIETFAQDIEKKEFCSSGAHASVICIKPDTFDADLCTALEQFANHYALNPAFFTRLIWQESRFKPNARSSADAMGIAQFIASTAEARGLDDPFNPAEALDASARYLAELEKDFDNLGLAAAAYNAGETAAANFQKKTAGLPNETWKYVQIITGLDARTWRDAPPNDHDFSLKKDQSFQQSCLDLAKTRKLDLDRDFQPQFKKWGVQLAAGKTREAAATSYKHRSRLCRRAIKDRKPDYIYSSPQVKLRRPSYVARISFDSRRKANTFCTRLKQYRCACAVYKN
ncbi:lytic transglycosylase domain-containing protein [Amylibacter sp. SFDW26]|nr:lytic transglycosylase domain-containing protein [Amylibacter sp. SFDW26]